MVLFLFIGINTNFTLKFPLSTINIREDSAFTYIYLKGGEFVGNSGYPQIPSFPLSIKRSKKILSVKISSLKSDTLVMNKPIYPLQPPKIISLNIPFKFAKNKILYNTKALYPEKDFLIVGSSDIILYPIHYIPAENILIISREMRIEVNYEIEGTKRAKSDSIEYAIITADSLKNAFQSLAEWKIRKGIKTEVFGLDTILTNFEGKDTQEKIRNFIIALYNTENLKWILLGGDTDIIPCRRLFAMASEAGFRPDDEDSIPADIYYADLQGNYDFDSNEIYGEVEDSIDLYPDVYLGRAPVHNSQEVENFVNKVIKYETAPDTTFINRYLFLGMILWNDDPLPYTDAGISKDRIDSLYVPDYIQIEKLYESRGNETPASVYQAMNDGYNITNHDGHGGYSVIGAGTGYLYIQDIDSLKNVDKEGIMYSIGCWVGAVDYDAIAEHYINNPAGGGVAFIGNSRYGWGSPGNPGFGYSDRFDEEFYHYLFSEEETHIGEIMTDAKAHFVPYSREANVYRWHQYEINLLGDPEMSVWTENPERITIISKDTINIHNPFEIGFLYEDNPIEGLYTCITSSSGEILSRNKTDGTGIIKYTLPDNFSGDSICIVGTGKNFIPAVKWIYTKNTQEPDIIDLSNYDYDRIIPENQNERLNLTLILPSTIHNVKISVSSPGYIKISPADVRYDSLTEITDKIYSIFSLYSDTLQDGEKIPIKVYLTSNEVSLEKEFIFIGGKPIINVLVQDIVPDTPYVIITKIINKGHLEAQNVKRWCPASEYVLYPYKSFGNISSMDTVLDTIYVSSDTINFIDYALMGNNFETKNYQIIINRKNILLYENWESENIWQHSGIKDLWRITSQRAHSGIFSLYCGTKNGYYDNDMDARIISPDIYVSNGTTLSFYIYNCFPNYGTDGLYVKIQKGDTIDTLDFIGSGGALKDFCNNWVKYTYPLKDYEDSVHLIFEFISDISDTSEGVYIDDIIVRSPNINLMEVSKFAPQNFIITFLRNPITDKDYIEVSTKENGDLIMEVYDVLGRQIDIVEKKAIKPGTYFYAFPFKLAKSGIYFLIGKMGTEKTLRKKFIFLK